jgi:hypothetical protein
MARKIKWTVVAWNDLEEEADYIAEDSPIMLWHLSVRHETQQVHWPT